VHHAWKIKQVERDVQRTKESPMKATGLKPQSITKREVERITK
jgi:hypothetical protein